MDETQWRSTSEEPEGFVLLAMPGGYMTVGRLIDGVVAWQEAHGTVAPADDLSDYWADEVGDTICFADSRTAPRFWMPLPAFPHPRACPSCKGSGLVGWPSLSQFEIETRASR